MKRILLLTNVIVFFLMISVFPQLSGNFTVGAGGTYDSLGAAIVALNTNGVSGPVKMLLLEGTHNIGANTWLGCNGTNSNNTITFKPNANATVVLNFLSDATSNIDGNFVIGSPTGTSANLVSTNYIIIDGSNTEGGTTKDLTINGVSTSTQRSVIRIFGNNDNITIKNCIIVNRSTSGSNTAPVQVTNYNNGSTNFIPDFIRIENNTLTSALGNGSTGVQVSNSGTPTSGITNLSILNNIVSARVRGFFISYTNDCTISGNTIEVNSQSSQGASGMSFQTNFATAGTFNIFNNKILRLRTLNGTAAASNGIIGIDNQNVSPKVVNIYNNFITGFESVAATTNSKLYGIRTSGTSNTKVYHNTIVIPDITDFSAFGTSFIAGVVYASTGEAAIASGDFDLKNNIIIVEENSMKVWGVRRVGTTANFTSNYNNIFKSAGAALGYVGFFNASDALTLGDWQLASSQDANSKSKSVIFTTATDLHLSGASNGDLDLRGTPVALVTTDIDGEARNETYPYMGADEAGTPLPVELTSLNAAVSGTSVTLKWTTATEVNSYLFQVEQRSLDTEWSTVSSVQASGNSNSPKNYQYTVESLTSGKYQFRLKMIDADGSFEYSEPVEVEISTPMEFHLSQNYPNPFNPATTINYTLPTAGSVTLQVYSMNGELVQTLVQGYQAAGSYSVTFDASGLASGTYAYRLITTGADGQTQSVLKKMLLMK